MTMEVRSTDGSVVVRFPDGTSPRVIKDAMKRASKPIEDVSDRPEAIPIPPSPPVSDVQPTIGQRIDTGIRAGARSAMVAAGGTLGGAAGIAGGTVLGGPPGGAVGLLGGSAAGAAAGSLAFDSLNDAIRTLGLEPLPGGTPPAGTGLETITERSLAAGREAMTEAAFTGGFSVLFPVKRFLAPLLGKVVGVRTDAAKEMAKLAEAQGIGLSAVDVGGPAAKGFARVLGIFPFVGTPLRTARGVKEAQISGRIADTLNEVAPTSTLAGEMGIDMAKAAEGSHAAFRSVANDLYEIFRAEARTLPVAAVPTEETVQTIKEYVSEARLGAIPLKSEDGVVQVLKGGIPEDFERFLVDAQNLPSHLTYEQWARFKLQLKGFIDSAAPDPFTVKRVVQIKQAMESDLNNLGSGLPEGSLDKESLDRILALKQNADTFFSTGITVFQTPTAQRFGRIDKNIFRVGPEVAGSLNADELLKPAFNAKSGQALADLRALVGEDTFRKASRAYLDDIVSKSFKTEVRGGETVEIFDLDAFQKGLGLVRGPQNRRTAVEEIFRGTGVKVDELVELIENARIAKLNDPSQFVARRATLGGAGAIAGAVGLGAFAGGSVSAGAGIAVPLAGILLAKHGARILADPKRLRALTAAFAPETPEVAKRALVLRIARSIGQELARPKQQKPQSNRPGPAARPNVVQ